MNAGDTRGHDIVTVRDREAPGSNPGPRPNFELKASCLGAAKVITRLYWCSRYVAVAL
jgi:hypothetical protein